MRSICQSPCGPALKVTVSIPVIALLFLGFTFRYALLAIACAAFNGSVELVLFKNARLTLKQRRRWAIQGAT
jgi:hypothetical protein